MFAYVSRVRAQKHLDRIYKERALMYNLRALKYDSRIQYMRLNV